MSPVPICSVRMLPSSAVARLVIRPADTLPKIGIFETSDAALVVAPKRARPVAADVLAALNGVAPPVPRFARNSRLLTPVMAALMARSACSCCAL